MKEQILQLIENNIQELRKELSQELNKTNNITHQDCLIIIAPINKLRDIKYQISQISDQL